MKRQNFSIYHFILPGIFLMLAISCKKDDDNNNQIPGNGLLTDARDGAVYKTVTIGDQVWMAENLKYLPSVNGPGTGSETTPLYYVIGYDGTNVSDAKATANFSKYGVLYNWTAAKTACPAGWHLPGDTEWTQLTDFLGGEAVSGGKLKETGTAHWNDPNEGATDEVGFTALPGSYRNINGTFNILGDYAYWWSATEYSDNNAWFRVIFFNSSVVFRNFQNKEVGYSVRCVKDK
jgi:uncharacterized protein (TIGR02145 family)